MASAVADLETGLQAMLNLKPPGVSGSRITSLTSLCVANIQSESVLIQKIYTQFKKAPGTHKLGVLYVVDSVTRKWLEQAKHQGQAINSSAQDGTFAAGVHRVTELMPVLMNDIIQTAPQEQKEKIKKLLDIWEKGQTFPASMIEGFREKLKAPPAQNESTTPTGSPPPNPLAALQGKQPAPAAQNVPTGSSILEALANIARQNTTAPPSSSGLPAPAASYSIPPSGLPQPVPSSIQQPQQAVSYPAAQQPVNVPSLPFPMPHLPAQTGQPVAAPSNPPFPGAPAPGGSSLDPNTQQQILLIKALADQGVPFDKIPAFLQSMGGIGATGTQPGNAPAPAPQNPYGPGAQPWQQTPAAGNDAHTRGYQDGVRSPRGQQRRSRSRSPDRGWGARDSPRNGRDRSDYGRNSPSRGHDDRNGRRNGDYRKRSPQGRHGRSPCPGSGLPHVDRWIDIDRTLPPGHIKVLSRTLFVGGVTCSEAELRGIFSRFGTVQTCIVNRDKRHAFVKMLTRRDAVAAKEGTEDSRNLEVPLRTRWGVGFGPRDCSDYATGISIIPISKLTEADRKWMLSAPYGGSGGRPIEDGLCVEEPDIEIGAGVSSKAISRRMQTDKGGSQGPKSTKGKDEDLSRWRRSRDRNDGGYGQGANNNSQGGNSGGGQPGMAAGFPFGIGTLPNGMPNFPAGFSFPDPNTNGTKWT